MSGGLLIGGGLCPVPGVNVIGPHDADWAHLSPGDYVMRQTLWVRQYILHKTVADDPEQILGGVGPTGADERTAEGWQAEFAHDRRYAGAHLLTGHDGRVACLADLRNVETFHATVSNAWSVGHETCELKGGGVYAAAMSATVETCLTACAALGIQLQMPKLGSYTGHPIPRMVHGGPDMVGIFGHRDNTEQRGKWDPGEALFEMLAARGVEQMDFAGGEDLKIWTRRQLALVKLGHALTCDGVAGPGTRAALLAAGFPGGIFALGSEELRASLGG